MDTILDYMNAFLGAFFLLISTVTIAEIRRSKKRIVFICVFVIVLLIIGIVKIGKDNEKDARLKQSSEKIDTLDKKVTDLLNYQRSDSLRDATFQQSLRKEYYIGRDSTSNKPYIVNKKYENTVNNHGTVNIDQR